MKMIKKTIAMLVIACVMISSVTVFAAFSAITTTQTVTEVKAGETVTIEATFDTLVDAKGMELEFLYDATAFSVDSTDDTEYNFGSKKNPEYWPNYIADGLKEQHLEECSFISKWPTFSYELPEGKVKFLATDSAGGHIMTEEDEAEDMYPYRTVGVIFTAKNDIAPGNYTFTINTKVSTGDGVISATKTVTVTVPGGAAGTDPVPVKKPVTPSDVVTTLKANDADYTNVAIWKATFEGLQEKGAINIGYDFTKEGSDKNFGKVITTEINGDGAVDFVLALYGVPAADVSLLHFNPYYTVEE